MSRVAPYVVHEMRKGLTRTGGEFSIGADGSVTAGYNIPGVATIAESVTGEYTITMEDKWQGLYSASLWLEKATSDQVSLRMKSEAILASKTIVFAMEGAPITQPVTIGMKVVAQQGLTVQPTDAVASCEGGDLSGPTTPNAQLTGTGNTTWNVDVAEYAAGLDEDGTMKHDIVAAGADLSIHAGSYLTGFANGNSCVAAIVAKNDAGTISTDSVKGTPATTGTQVAPTDAEITAEVGHTNWIKLGETTLNRTADTTVTESHDNTKLESGKPAATSYAENPGACTGHLLLEMKNTSY